MYAVFDCIVDENSEDLQDLELSFGYTTIDHHEVVPSSTRRIYQIIINKISFDDM